MPVAIFETQPVEEGRVNGVSPGPLLVGHGLRRLRAGASTAPVAVVQILECQSDSGQYVFRFATGVAEKQQPAIVADADVQGRLAVIMSRTTGYPAAARPLFKTISRQCRENVFLH